MKEQLERRLRELQAEYKLGQTTLAELQTQQANLQQTLLRISGAIQVLEEELSKADPSAHHEHTLVPESHTVVPAAPPAPASLPH
jgi:uncharacterized coiled-coil protein SlyX